MAINFEKVMNIADFSENVRKYIEDNGLAPPLSLQELTRYADAVRLLSDPPIDATLAAIALNNALWRGIVASIPFERRILMLPQCLRDSSRCQAETDAIGLVCGRCGACPIGELQYLAENLGYVVLVAEGTTVVSKLIESGKIDAVIGVSCAHALERAFPHMAAGAVPGIAIPLDNDGCADTTVDIPAVVEAIKLRADGVTAAMIDVDELSSHVSEWFIRDQLVAVLGIPDDVPVDSTESLALDWLSKSGKRWRPFFTVATYSALTGTRDEFPKFLVKAAVAVECFHKASLIHDDIEDGDDFRYGDSTQHMLHGVPLALNVGDYLIGLGYELLAEAGRYSEKTAQMLTVAADCHKRLCVGQGAELAVRENFRQPLSSRAILEVFRGKTSPAFEAALALGAICADAQPELLAILGAYSDALGVAYQIKDDIEDFASLERANVADGGIFMRSSVVAAIAWELADERKRCVMERFFATGEGGDAIFTVETMAKASQLLEHHRLEAIRSIDSLGNAALKSFLRRVITKATKLAGAD